jgi:hypothetical protein
MLEKKSEKEESSFRGWSKCGDDGNRRRVTEAKRRTQPRKVEMEMRGPKTTILRRKHRLTGRGRRVTKTRKEYKEGDSEKEDMMGKRERRRST